MRVNDILESYNLDSVERGSYKKFQYNISHKMKSGELEHLGSGIFAIVYDVPHETNTVMKVSDRILTINDINKDGYLSYIDAIGGEIEENQNPYLPRVHKIEFIYDEDKDGYYYKVYMEKLHEVDWRVGSGDIDHGDEEHGMYQQLKVASEKALGMDLGTVSSPYRKMQHAMDAYLRTGKFPGGIDKGDVDKRLVRALDIIRSVGGGIDLHEGNIMMRKTPYGLQFVITDPLY